MTLLIKLEKDSEGLKRAGYTDHTKIACRWPRDDHDSMLGIQDRELEEGVYQLKEAFEITLIQGGHLAPSSIDETILSAQWILPGLNDPLIDNWHTDSHFFFSAISGLPIQAYGGRASGEGNRLGIDDVKILDERGVRTSNFGDIWEVQRRTAHQRGFFAVNPTEPILRMSMRTIVKPFNY